MKRVSKERGETEHYATPYVCKECVREHAQQAELLPAAMFFQSVNFVLNFISEFPCHDSFYCSFLVRDLSINTIYYFLEGLVLLLAWYHCAVQGRVVS